MSYYHCSLNQMVSTIVDSYQNLWNFRKAFEQTNFANFDIAAIESSLYWDPAFLPNFGVHAGSIVCRQVNFFGTLMLGEAIAELLMGIETLGGYFLLEKAGYDPLATFVAYSASFHLIDSFLCLRGIFYIPFPTQYLKWQTFRRVGQQPFKGTPIMRLESERLRINDDKPTHVLAAWNPSKSVWEFSPVSQPSVHKSRWRTYGEVLSQMVQTSGPSAIPKEVQQFLGYFAGRLAYLATGVLQTPTGTKAGLKQLIRMACLDFPLYGRRLPPGVPDMRSLAIYKNRSIDEYTRLTGESLDPTILGPIEKMAGIYFRRHAQGLARYQANALNSILDAVKKSFSSNPEIFDNGLLSSFLMSNLVQLDYDKILASDVYRSLQPDLRAVVQAIFGSGGWIGIPQDISSWSVGNKTNPIFHTMRDPITFGLCVTPSNSWPRPAAHHWYSGLILPTSLPTLVGSALRWTLSR